MTGTEQADFVTWREGGLAFVEFRSPATRNALSIASHDLLERYFYDICTDSSVSCIILTGQGETFCSGANLKVHEQEIAPHVAAQDWSLLYLRAVRILSNLLSLRQPIIAAVNGPAIGIGATLALACDVVVAAEDAYFADAHVASMGVPAGDGGTLLWPLGVNAYVAKRALMLGEAISAPEMQDLGVVTECLPRADLLDAARRIAGRFDALPAEAVRWTKMSLNRTVLQGLHLSLDPALSAEMHAIDVATRTTPAPGQG